MFDEFKNKLLCWLGRHAWVEHDRGFHRICSRCGKTHWIVDPTSGEPPNPRGER